MDKLIPASIRPLLQNYLQLLAHQTSDLAVACYLHGSIALDAFNERLSDIDFLTVLHRSPTSQEIMHLQTIHRSLTTTYPRWRLDGSYIQWHDVGRLSDAIAPCPYVAQGVFHPQGYRDLNLVTWWILKHHGVAILGASPQTLQFTVNWDMLEVKMHDNLNSYWRSWTRTPTRIVQLFTDYGIQWAVLGVLRVWYSLREQDITSKTNAGRYALTHLPSRWHPLIREAINLRDDPEHRFYRFHICRACDAVKFLHYIIQLCNVRSSSDEFPLIF